MKILLLAPEFDFNEEWRAALKSTLPNDELYEGDQFAPDDVEIAIVYNPPHKILRRYSNLIAIISLSAGVDGLLSDNSLPNVPIIRLVTDDIVYLMREYVIYQVLRIHRDFAAIEQQHQRREWQWMPPYHPASHLRVSVLGLGRLGMPCVIALSHLGFKVSGWSRRLKNIPNVSCFAGDEGLSLLLPRTDILICLLPLTDTTYNILSSSLFNQLPRGASIINVSRGGCLNEKDLLKELENGKIAHATLDVFNIEPLPLSHPFWMHPRITITPHVAADSRPCSSALEIADIISRLRNGKSLTNLVCRVKGY